jgi:hypothetical protein
VRRRRQVQVSRRGNDYFDWNALLRLRTIASFPLVDPCVRFHIGVQPALAVDVQRNTELQIGVLTLPQSRAYDYRYDVSQDVHDVRGPQPVNLLSRLYFVKVPPIFEYFMGFSRFPWSLVGPPFSHLFPLLSGPSLSSEPASKK